MNVSISGDLYKKLERVCGMTGQAPGDIVNTLVAQHVKEYCNRFGEFEPVEATLLSVPDMHGEQREEGICHVLDKMSIMGMPYYKIFYQGHLIKAPANCIVFKEKGELD